MIDVAKARAAWDRKNYELDMDRRAEGIAREAIALALEDAAEEQDRRGDDRNAQANEFRKDRRLEHLLHTERDFYRQQAGDLRALASRYRQGGQPDGK